MKKILILSIVFFIKQSHPKDISWKYRPDKCKKRYENCLNNRQCKDNQVCKERCKAWACAGECPSNLCP